MGRMYTVRIADSHHMNIEPRVNQRKVAKAALKVHHSQREEKAIEIPGSSLTMYNTGSYMYAAVQLPDYVR